MLGFKSAKVGVVELLYASFTDEFSIPKSLVNLLINTTRFSEWNKICNCDDADTSMSVHTLNYGPKKMSSIFAMWTCHLYVALFHLPLHKECIPLDSLWHGWPTLAILFWPFSFFASKTIYLALQCIQFEWRWWRLFLKRVVHTKGDTCGFCFASKEFFLACKERVTL